MVSITDRAKAHVLRLIRENNLGDVSLRFGITGGGCSGHNYDLSFTNEVKDGDKVYDCGELKIVVDKLSRPLVGNTRIDWEESLYGSGFSFSNPLAQSTCGCGQSFSVEEPAAGQGGQS